MTSSSVQVAIVPTITGAHARVPAPGDPDDSRLGSVGNSAPQVVNPPAKPGTHQHPEESSSAHVRGRAGPAPGEQDAEKESADDGLITEDRPRDAVGRKSASMMRPYAPRRRPQHAGEDGTDVVRTQMRCRSLRRRCRRGNRDRPEGRDVVSCAGPRSAAVGVECMRFPHVGASMARHLG